MGNENVIQEGKDTLKIKSSQSLNILTPDLEVLKQSKNLTDKEIIVMTEVLNFRKSRSRSSSRMGRDISLKDARKNESVVNKSDTNEAVRSERIHQKKVPGIATSFDKQEHKHSRETIQQDKDEAMSKGDTQNLKHDNRQKKHNISGKTESHQTEQDDGMTLK